MKTKYFATLIPYDHPLADNDYVAGRISAAFRLICNTDKLICYCIPQGLGHCDTCYVVLATSEQYDKFKSVLEKWYPGLCKFEYPLEKIETKLPEWL